MDCRYRPEKSETLKIVARIKNIDEVNRFDRLNVDVFCLDGEFTTKKISYFSIDEIKLVVNKAKVLNKQVFVYVNKMIHEVDLPGLESYLTSLGEYCIDGIVINDLTVYAIAKKLGMESNIIYQPGSLNTDSFSAEYFADRKILGITVSREVTLAEIERIATNKKRTGLSIIGHGYLDMFYSKRKLLRNYFLHKGISGKEIVDNHRYRLNEEMRSNQFYPIVEDDAGTHIFRAMKLISIDEIELLSKFIDYLFIERIFLDDEEYIDSLSLYAKKQRKEDFLEKYPNYESGFYYQRTEKLKGDLDES